MNRTIINKINFKIKIARIRNIPKKNDLALWVSWLNNKKTSIYSNRQFKKHTVNSQKNFIKNKLNINKSILFKILYNKIFIGIVEIDKIDLNHNHCEIGFMIGNTKYMNRGFATKAIKLLIKFCKKKKLRMLYGISYSKNKASIKVFVKNGFKKVAKIKNYFQLKNSNKKDDMLFFIKNLK